MSIGGGARREQKANLICNTCVMYVVMHKVRWNIVFPRYQSRSRTTSILLLTHMTGGWTCERKRNMPIDVSEYSDYNLFML